MYFLSYNVFILKKGGFSMDLEKFFARAIELREEYAKTSQHRLQILSQIVGHVFANGEFTRSISIEHPFSHFYDLISEKDFQKVFDDLSINYHLDHYGEIPSSCQRYYRATIIRNND